MMMWHLLLGFVLFLPFLPIVTSGRIQEELLSRLRGKLQFEPQAIVDVGANQGVYSKSVRKYFPSTAIFMVEASTQHDELLAQVARDLGQSEHRIAVLSSTSGEKVEFFVDENSKTGTGNSMFKENTKFYKDAVPIERTTETLDDLVAESTLLSGKWVDMVKADVQGAELLVFGGATKTLAQATFVQFEGSTVQYNDGGSCFFEVDAYLRSQGFYLYDMADLTYDKGLFRTFGLGQFDILYVKPTSPRLPEKLKIAKFCGQGGEAAKTLGMTNMFPPPTSTQYVIPMHSAQRARSWLFGFVFGVLFCLVAQQVFERLFFRTARDTKLS